jgi:hypothetical protein
MRVDVRKIESLRTSLNDEGSLGSTWKKAAAKVDLDESLVPLDYNNQF